MKSTQKGNQYEKEVRDILTRQKWLVEGQHRKVMYIRDKYTQQMKLIMAGRDIFGCDLIAKKLGAKTRWIQVSTVAQKSVKQRQVMEFPWNLAYESIELWLRVDGKREFRVFVLDVDGTFHEIGRETVKGEANEIEYPDGLEGVEKKMASGDAE